MKHFLIASCVFLVACASLQPEPQASVEEGLIFERTRIPAFTGYLETWIVFKVRNGRRDFDFYYQHFNNGNVIPNVGDTCTFTYRVGHVEGVAGEGFIDLKEALIVDRFQCVSE